MRRTILTSLAAAAAALVIPVSLAAAEPELADTQGESTLDQPILSAARVLEPMRLGCEVRSTDEGSVVGCKWSEPGSPRVASVRLFRLDPNVDPHRMVVYRSEDLTQTAFTDSKVRAGHRYAYAVQTYDANGRVVGRSRAEWVRIPPIDDPAVEVLKLACALGDSGEWVGCEWSRPVRTDASVVSLWRSVDSGDRELVEQFRPEGPSVYRDAVPAGAGSITYAVVATTESDRVVARSRPVTVRIPQTDVRPVGTRPVDSRPVDSRPVDTVPHVTSPPVTRPLETVAPVTVPPVTRPVDTRPVDTVAPVTAQVDTVVPATRPVDARRVGVVAP